MRLMMQDKRGIFMKIKLVRNAVLVGAIALLGACSTRSSASIPMASTEVTCRGCELPPGVAQYVWEPPMVDVIEVPPGLDPDGIYYRPAHQEVVEIRQGRWRYYKDK